MPIFEEQAKSGLSKNAWCERNGIRKWEFYERQRECRRYLLKKDNDLKDVSEVISLIPSFVELPAETGAAVSPDKESVTQGSSGNIEVTCGKFGVSIIGEVNEYRGQGIGTQLMKDMLALLKKKGYERASLAVQKANYAVLMYEKVGFRTVDENDEEFIMVCEL
ncbi:MAG: GNAT family N-acetyltransferase [Lachnospiraceae bacterium]|nr:GNAT family N-acetyltransferase [Lachnospiraceae bacterium]